jgi:hypothetical protein
MKKLLFPFLLILPFIFSCTNEPKTVYPISEEILEVRSGQSFGMCIGTCYNEIIITGDKIALKQITRSERGGESTTSEKIVENANLQPIVQEIKKVKEKDFLVLKDVYGCPDCADGGAEWLEITFKGNKTKKVTFEYGKSIPGFEEITTTLHTYRLSLIDKKR